MCKCEKTLERLQQRRKQRVRTMNNPELKLVKLGYDYRLVLKDEKEEVKFEVKNSANAEHFITQHYYNLDDATITNAGKEVLVKTGLVQLSKTASYFIEDDEWELLQIAQLTDKAVELISAVENN